MKPIVILADTRRLGTCRSCGAEIEWATVAASEKAMPFNRPIVLEPALALDDSMNIVRVDMEKTTSHFATCPDAKKWRGGQRGGKMRGHHG
jgi:hypothetical protein